MYICGILSVLYLKYFIAMIIEIDQPVTPKKVQEALDKMQRGKKNKSLRKHFGKLKRDIDAVSYQKSLRDDWT